MTSQASSSATTHKIYLILLRRSKAFHWRQHIKTLGRGSITTSPPPPLRLVPLWGYEFAICLYVRGLSNSTARSEKNDKEEFLKCGVAGKCHDYFNRGDHSVSKLRTSEESIPENFRECFKGFGRCLEKNTGTVFFSSWEIVPLKLVQWVKKKNKSHSDTTA